MNNSPKNRGTDIISVILRRQETGTLLPLIIMLTVVSIVNVKFLSGGNLIDILRTATYSFIVAAPLTFLMISGELDLSIGAVTSLGGVVCAFSLMAGINIWISIIFGILSGTLVGLIKALIVIRLKLPGFIVTLALQYVTNGLLLVLTNGTPISGFSPSFKKIGQGALFGAIYYTIIIAVAIGVLFQIVLTKTKYGRKIIAVGGNIETARLSGIKVKPIKMGIHVIVSTFAALSGVLMASRFAAAISSIGSGTELTIMAAVLIGGTSLYGGSGSIWGTAIGCLLLAVIGNGLVFMRVSGHWQNLIFGLVLLMSIGIDRYRQTISSRI